MLSSSTYIYMAKICHLLIYNFTFIVLLNLYPYLLHRFIFSNYNNKYFLKGYKSIQIILQEVHGY